MNKFDVSSIAASLFDGGWRAADRDRIMDEYDYIISPDDLDDICGLLAYYATI